MRRLVETVLLATCALVFTAPSAGAAFPGTNGKIVFDRLSPSPSEVQSINGDGSGVATLTTRGINGNPDWSADGTEIAFVHANAGGNGWSLMRMAADGSAKTTILSSFPRGFPLPSTLSWSPDGTEIAFCAVGGQGSRVFIVNADGTVGTNISGTHQDRDPEWSPDGTELVVNTFARHVAYVVSMNTDGTGRTRITKGYEPDCSPDGTRVVFVTWGGESNIATIASDGTGFALVTDTKRRFEFAPAYSPDGTEIVFSRGQTSDIASPNDLWTIHVDGSSPFRLTDTAKRNEFDADWQPT